MYFSEKKIAFACFSDSLYFNLPEEFKLSMYPVNETCLMEKSSDCLTANIASLYLCMEIELGKEPLNKDKRITPNAVLVCSLAKLLNESKMKKTSCLTNNPQVEYSSFIMDYNFIFKHTYSCALFISTSLFHWRAFS